MVRLDSQVALVQREMMAYLVSLEARERGASQDLKGLLEDLEEMAYLA
jgi:hypothetical protein